MLEIRGLVVMRDRARVLTEVDLDVGEASIVALLGRNGAGKSTLVQTVAGLLRPAAGSVFFRGQRIDRLPATARASLGIGVVLEGRQLFPELSVEDNLRLGAFGALAHSKGWAPLLGTMRAELKERLEYVYGLFPRLRELARRRAGLLSGGEQQMVALGRALVLRPSLLVVDELSLGLAPKVAYSLAEHLKLLAAQGVAVLLSEQNVGLALNLAQHVYVLNGGRVEFSGPPESLVATSDVVRSYLGVAGRGQS
jgi:branched-chain amino acid transport system ATP-binding protein